MSCSLDVNILLYASDSTSRFHVEATAFLQSLIKGSEACYLCWVTIMSYLRMATHPRIFSSPLSPAAAESNVRQLLARPQFRTIAETDGFWSVYEEIAADTPVRGNLVPDAHLAALLKLHGIRTLYTCDRDFLKFRFLHVVDPLAMAI